MRTIWGRSKTAYLTVFMTFVLAALLPLCLVLVEGARISAIRLESEIAANVANDSILAEFHRELLKKYDIFAIDNTYGTGVSSVANMEKHLKEYTKKNLDTEDVFLSYFLYKDYLCLTEKECKITAVSYLTDASGAVFRKRASEAMKDIAGTEIYSLLKNRITSIEINQLEDLHVEEIMDQKRAESDAMAAEAKKQILEEQEEEVEYSNPAGGLVGVRYAGILNSVIGNAGVISQKYLNYDNPVSARIREGRQNVGNMSPEKNEWAEETLENALFLEYVMKYLSCYGGEAGNEDALDYQVEYVIAGKSSDVENLRSIAERLCVLRCAADYLYLISDEEKCEITKALAEAIAALLLCPEIAEPLNQLFLAGWAYMEGIYDVKCLFQGESVPLWKTDETWHYSLEHAFSGSVDAVPASTGTDYRDPPSFSEHVQSLSEGKLYYRDYLRIFLLMGGMEQMTLRTMDMMEAQIRITEGNEQFRMDACVDCFRSRIEMESAFGYSYSYTGKYNYRSQ